MAIAQTLKEMFMGADITSLQGLFLMGLKDIYHAEKQLVDALETMADEATTKELKTAFINHRKETQTQVTRLEQIFAMMDLEPEAKTCQAIEGLIEESNEVISATEGYVKDAGLIFAGQGVEHYEMARYGTLCAWAKELGMTEAAKLLEATLEEEKAADALLSSLAEGGVNEAALTGDEVTINLSTRKSSSKSATSTRRSHA